MPDIHYVYLIASVLAASLSQLLLKKGAMQHHASLWREYWNPWVLCGYLVLLGSVFLTICGLRGLEYLNAPIVESLGYVLVPVLGAVFFREKLGWRRLVGIVCIVIGMVVFYI